MAKLSKAEFKQQEQIFQLLQKDKLTEQEVWSIYQDINPGFIDNLQKGVYFTPIELAADFALMSYRYGNVVDVCAGIGGLSHCMKLRDTYEGSIKSFTCIELNPEFVKIGKKLLPEANWICANAFDKELWSNITSTLPGNKFDVLISNPPFGKCPSNAKPDWLNYTEELELMVMELALKFSNNAYMILPAGSIEFKEEPYYQRVKSNKVEKFRKKNSQFFFQESMSISSDIYKQDWKNLASINVECVEICMNESDYT